MSELRISHPKCRDAPSFYDKHHTRISNPKFKNALSFVQGSHEAAADVGAGTGPGVPAGDRRAGGNRTGCLTPVPFLELDEIWFCIHASDAANRAQVRNLSINHGHGAVRSDWSVNR